MGIFLSDFFGKLNLARGGVIPLEGGTKRGNRQVEEEVEELQTVSHDIDALCAGALSPSASVKKKTGRASASSSQSRRGHRLHT